ncbi:LysR family transcriptional regulator [Variovorax terrae]|uniref:LysR substrate-binding domain-containing protein n=1 Tax=Variovorax terrae TaxID=2923278 RepID=A0A9X1VYV7_9BURK|nr:LysR substrate-binding domain-containing protein [Variovorax terrae]MCJ0765895.1 LysR substrate-binding domain-containing protein [Variovorax terrae]
MPKNHDDDPLHAVIRSRFRLRHLEVFRNVCELHTLRKAAAASNMTQPAATKLIQELEDMFRVVLFQRNRRGMQLTPHGEILRRHVGVVLADIGNISSELDQFTRGGGGIVRLGILPSLSSALLARCINDFLEDHPRVQFSVHEGTTDELLGQLSRNHLDLTFGRVLHVSHSGMLRVTRVYTEAFDIVCACHHRLAKQEDVRWKELAGERWVLPAVGSPLREIADSMFTARGDLRPVVSIACSSFHQMRYVIASGSLLGVLPQSIARRAMSDGDLVVLRPKQATQVAPISIMTRGDLETPPIIAAFERSILQTAKTLSLK